MAIEPGIRKFWLSSSGLNQYARLDRDQRARPRPAGQLARETASCSQPVAPDALDIVLDQPGGVGIAAVDEHLHRGRLAAAQPSAKSAASTTTPLSRPATRSSSTSARWRATRDVEDSANCGTRPASCRPRASAARPPRPTGDAPQVERDAVAEDEQQQQRQHAGDQDSCSGRGRICSDLLAHQAGDRGAAGPATRCTRRRHGRLPSLVVASTSAMKASSSVGSGRSALRTRVLQLVGRALGDDLAAVDQADAVAILGLVEEMGRHHHRHAALDHGIDVRPELAPRQRIDAGGRLVEEQHRRARASRRRPAPAAA